MISFALAGFCGHCPMRKDLNPDFFQKEIRAIAEVERLTGLLVVSTNRDEDLEKGRRLEKLHGGAVPTSFLVVGETPRYPALNGPSTRQLQQGGATWFKLNSRRNSCGARAFS